MLCRVCSTLMNGVETYLNMVVKMQKAGSIFHHHLATTQSVVKHFLPEVYTSLGEWYIMSQVRRGKAFIYQFEIVHLGPSSL